MSEKLCSATFILIASVLLCACDSKEKNIQGYIDKISFLSQKENYDKFEVIKILSDGLLKYPGEKKLLDRRASFYCSHGFLPECRSDTLLILKQDPNRAEAIMGLCMLDELEGVDLSLVKSCYMDAAKIFRTRKSKHIESDISNKYNFVIALLMAEHPDAHKERTILLELIESTPGYSAWIYDKSLSEFDRNKFLKDIFNK